MKVISSGSRTDACGRYGGEYRTVVLTQKEWDEKAKTLKVHKPYTRSIYSLGCGWSDTEYEMAMLETEYTGGYIMLNDGRGGVGRTYCDYTYLLEGHEKPLMTRHTETMNEYNS